jgi:hypothetical protein
MPTPTPTPTPTGGPSIPAFHNHVQQQQCGLQLCYMRVSVLQRNVCRVLLLCLHNCLQQREAAMAAMGHDSKGGCLTGVIPRTSNNRRGLASSEFACLPVTTDKLVGCRFRLG